jgi:hypothetical protein
MKRRTGILALSLLASVSSWGGPQALASPSPSPAPAADDIIPAFDAEGLAGLPVHVAFPKGSQTVLIFFMSGCPHCQRMIPLWNGAFEHKSPKLTVLGVLMDREPPGFFQAMPISFPVLRAPSNSFLHSLKIRSAPVTMRVGDGGRVTDVALGELDGIRLGQLFAP